MKKALGQTVRDLKKEVNKKVLKVPSIEQKVLDATSNEPWGPHGSHLADIAQATRNYHEYQMIMSVIWKRVNDTGKNWRHVYKALTVLEYLVANGSERVIDEIREHAYQISTLSDFQYIDSSGRDQGSNVRKKSQSLVVLVNDKERIQEVRQKAAANRDKFRNTSVGGMYKPGSYSGVGGYGERYYDDRYGSRDEDRNGYGRERDWDSNSRDSDRYGRDSEERYDRDGYRDDDSRGRSQSVDPYNYGSRSRSSDRDRDRSYEDDGQFSSRRSGAKADDRSQDGSVAGKRLDQKYSEQNLGAPPNYEEAVGDAHSPTHSERDGDTSAASVPKSSSPLTTIHQETTTSSTPVAPSPAPVPAPSPALAPASENKEFDGFDEFDPRGSFKAVAEVDFLSDPYSLNSLAIVPTTTATTTTESGAFTNSSSGNGFPSESTASKQPFEDPFGDGPFRAISSTDSFPAQQQNVASTSSFHPSSNHSDPSQQTSPNTEAVNNFGFEDTDILADIFPPSGSSATGFPAQTVHPSSETVFQGQMGQPSSMTGYPGQQAPQAGFQGQMGQPSSMTGYPEQDGQHAPQAGFPQPGGQHTSLTGFPSQMGTAQQAGFPAPSQPAHPGPNFYGSFNQQQGSTAPVVQPTTQTPTGPPAQYNTMNFNPQSPQMQQEGLSAYHRTSSLPASTNSLAIVPQPAKDKFETKSTVWVDTLNRGLVNLNISGSKTNALADIGVDFDAINRKEKRMEKPSQTPVVSTITMGKAMGSGSGIGRAGAGAIRGTPNPMMGSGFHMGMGGAPVGAMGVGGAPVGAMGVGGGRGPGMGMGMGGGPGAGMGMGMGGGPGAGMGMGMGMGSGYGVNQPMGGMGMRMNMGMGQGIQMQQPPTGFPAGSNMPAGYNPVMGTGSTMPAGYNPMMGTGSNMPAGYNPMMGTGNYGQQPYNGGYR